MKITIDSSYKYYYVVYESGDIVPEGAGDFLGAKRQGPRAFKVERNLVNDLILHQVQEHSFVHGLEDVPSQHLLHEFQVTDVRRMTNIHTPNILNANPMGLGKTVETIIAMRSLVLQHPEETGGGKNFRALVVCPKSVRLQWTSEIGKWWPDAPIAFVATKENWGADWILRDSEIIVCNYESLLDPTFGRKVRSRSWNVIVCDEAHRIKNKGTKRTVAVKSVPAKRHWALTGTPMLRGPEDLWSILHYLSPYYSGASYWNFVNYFCKVVQTPFGLKVEGLSEEPGRVEVLNTLMRIVSIRNESVEAAFGKVVETIKLDMGEKGKGVRKLYDDTVGLLLDELPEGLTIPNGAVKTIRLRQITSWPGLFASKGVKEAGVKFEWIKDLMEDNPNEKIVVFTAFAKTAIALQKFLGTGVVATITGQASAEENATAKNDFLKDSKVRIIVGTIGAMGEGFDGLQHVARVCVMLERDWTPSLNEQCEERLHRYGQKLPVIVYYLECAKTFDQHVARINVQRTDDIRRALRGE